MVLVGGLPAFAGYFTLTSPGTTGHRPGRSRQVAGGAAAGTTSQPGGSGRAVIITDLSRRTGKHMTTTLNERSYVFAEQQIKNGNVVRDQRDDWSEHQPSAGGH